LGTVSVLLLSDYFLFSFTRKDIGATLKGIMKSALMSGFFPKFVSAFPVKLGT